MGGQLANKVDSRYETLARDVRDVLTTKFIQHIIKACTRQPAASNTVIRQAFNCIPDNAKTVLTAYMWAAGINLWTCQQNFLSVTERHQRYQKLALEYDIPGSDIADEMDWAFVGTPVFDQRTLLTKYREKYLAVSPLQSMT
jgi:hypothetical protein